MSKNLVYETVGELFCGPGGGALGASMSSFTDKNKEVRIRHSWATDYDKDTCETYLKIFLNMRQDVTAGRML